MLNGWFKKNLASEKPLSSNIKSYRPLNSHGVGDHSHLQSKLTGKTCLIPFSEFHIYDNGFVSNCCFSWLPKEIGNLNETSLLQMLEEEPSQNIQKSVLDGSYKYCSTENCPALNRLIHQDEVSEPLVETKTFEKNRKKFKRIRLFLSYDKTCNLFCESCRNEKIFFSKSTAPADLLKLHERVFQQINELLAAGYSVELGVTGSGDAFASPLFYDLMVRLPDSPNLNLKLLTNGTMMTRQKLSALRPKSIQYVSVSADAATPEVYERVRRGGNFSHLEKNLQDFDIMVAKGQFPNFHGWELNFIAQEANYHQMGDFVEWAEQFKTLNTISFLVIQDWGHLNSQQFLQKAIWHKTHVKHESFLEHLADPRLKSSRVNLGNLLQFFKS